jgi:hypothetical protein
MVGGNIELCTNDSLACRAGILFLFLFRILEGGGVRVEKKEKGGKGV